MTGEARRKEIRRIHRMHRLFYELLGGLVLLAIGILIGALWLEVDILGDNSTDYRMNLVTEGLGIAATVFIINRWYSHRARETLKRRLLREVRTPSNDIALSAIVQMRDEGWLTDEDGVLKREDLSGANLQNADLRGANLKKATLHANLRGAKLDGANLQEASLIGADLYDAKLHKTDLQEAVLVCTDLREANLVKANLTKANMLMAKLEGAHLWETILIKSDLRDVELKKARWLNTAKLERAIMRHVDLQGVDLKDANLRKADLFGANLQETNLTSADLEKANLLGAYLKGAHVLLWEQSVGTRWVEAEEPMEWKTFPPTILRGATLPDGTRFPVDPPLQWDIHLFNQLQKFTNPDHPDFPTTLAGIKRIRRSWGLAD